jgi:transposase-like protein
MSDRIMNSRKTRRRLAPSEKYEMFVSVLTGQATQREAAAKWGVDRSAFRLGAGPARADRKEYGR